MCPCWIRQYIKSSFTVTPIYNQPCSTFHSTLEYYRRLLPNQKHTCVDFFPAIFFSYTSSFILLQINIIVFILFCQGFFSPLHTLTQTLTYTSVWWAERLMLAGCLQYLHSFRGEIVRFSMYLSLLNDCSFPARRRRASVE